MATPILGSTPRAPPPSPTSNKSILPMPTTVPATKCAGSIDGVVEMKGPVTEVYNLSVKSPVSHSEDSKESKVKVANPRTTLKPHKRDTLLATSKVSGHANFVTEQESGVTTNPSVNSAKEGLLRKRDIKDSVRSGKSGHVYNTKNTQRTSNVRLICPVNTSEETSKVMDTTSPSSSSSSESETLTVNNVPVKEKDTTRKNQSQESSILQKLHEPSHLNSTVVISQKPQESSYHEASVPSSKLYCEVQKVQTSATILHLPHKSSCLETSVPVPQLPVESSVRLRGKQSPHNISDKHIQRASNGDDSVDVTDKNKLNQDKQYTSM